MIVANGDVLDVSCWYGGEIVSHDKLFHSLPPSGKILRLKFNFSYSIRCNEDENLLVNNGADQVSVKGLKIRNDEVGI